MCRAWFSGLFSLIILVISSHSLANTLKMSVMFINGEQRESFDKINRLFNEHHPSIRILLRGMDDKNYKLNMDRLMKGWKNYDIIYWQGGHRLFRYIDAQLVAPVTELWDKNGFDRQFSSAMKRLVASGDKIYAMPYSYYTWGFVYNQNIFDELQLSVPKTWGEFLAVCKKIQEGGYLPLTIGIKNEWPAAAWFDYLNLRMNGYEFYIDLLNGKNSYQDPRVARVFKHWKYLLKKQYFPQQAKEWDWGEAMKLMYEGKAAMTLIGTFVFSEFSSFPEQSKALRFFPFPIFDPSIPKAELAPVDIFLIPTSSHKKALARKFISFVGQANTQEVINKKSKTLPPNNRAQIEDNYYFQAAAKSLQEAKHIMQYFDRDTNRKMAKAGIKIFKDFMLDGNAEKAIEALETARHIAFDIEPDRVVVPK